MKYFDFKKVGSVLASVAMLGATAGIAAAAAYPSTFIANNGNDTAIVVGSNADALDFTAATDIGANLNAAITTSLIGGGAVTTTGETYAVFSGTKIYLNDSLNKAKSSLTESNLPSILAEGEFNGNVDSDYTQRLVLGSNPQVVFAKEPTGNEDPQVALLLSTSASNYIYNATVSFTDAIDFTHADSQGEELVLFGQEFTVAAATTSTKLILLKSSQTLDLSVGASVEGFTANPLETVIIDGNTYTVELVSATDTSATIRVTDSDGDSDSKEINEAASKKIQGLEVAIKNADESEATNKLTAEVSVGANKVTFTAGEAVKLGDDTIEGTNVAVNGNFSALTKLTIQVAATIDDEDAILPGGSFIDPIFGTFKIDFAGLNIGNDDDSREDITIGNSGTYGMDISFTDYNGDSIETFTWVYNKSDSIGGEMRLAVDRKDQIIVREMAPVNRSGYVLLGNEDAGGLFKVSTLSNSSNKGNLILTDQITLQTHESTTATGESSAEISIRGQDYTWSFDFPTTTSSDAKTVRFNFGESTGNDVILFPTIETSKGANLAFYEPTTVALDNFDGAGAGLSNVSNFKFPNGDGYTSVALVRSDGTNYTFGGSVQVNTSLQTTQVTASVGQLTYAFNSTGTTNDIKIYLQDTTGANIVRPAIVLFEEQDDDLNQYNAVIITLDAGYGSNAELGILDADRTWDSDTLWDEIQLDSDTDMYKEMDIWGTLITIDDSDSGHKTAVISYPDEQVYAQIYFSALDASVSTGSSGVGNIIPVTDAENVAGKNLIVVGGSCINSVAAELLGGARCGPEFTTATGVGAGEYMIETFSRTGGKIATLVAGYNAADTAAAVSALTSNLPIIDAGVRYDGDSSGAFAMV